MNESGFKGARGGHSVCLPSYTVERVHNEYNILPWRIM